MVLKPRKALKFWQRCFIFNRDNFTCKICGIHPENIPLNYDGKNTIYCQNTFLVLDHIIPYSKGGECILDNLQTLCDICNAKKYNNG